MGNRTNLILSVFVIVLLSVIVWQEFQIQGLKTGAPILANQNEVNAYDLQQRCAQDSAKFFPGSLDPGAVNTTYVDYYNSKLNECFIDVSEQLGVNSNYVETVWDVNTQDIYAMYNAKSPALGIRALLCTVGTAKCTTLDEFHSLITQKYGIAQGNNF